MISEKIKTQIVDLQVDEDLKSLMLKILEEEDRGIYKFKDLFDKLVNEYIDKKVKEENINGMVAINVVRVALTATFIKVMPKEMLTQIS